MRSGVCDGRSFPAPAKITQISPNSKFEREKTS